ncbi:Acrosin, serine protease [Nesidiocoris tenuis]|uniref:Acrosin, serine protease n=1 Tax=Nesidiocoris tenuis TaxID=355587 RepID=A0ABN7B857_9HEMI|nr:Acrosin, serine protease [Nesidiocoris tenuis]
MLRIFGPLLCFASVFGQQRISLKPGDPYAKAVRTSNYPEITSGLEEKWILTTEPGSRIRVFCLDYRFIVDDKAPCAVGNTTFEFGSERIVKCGNERDVYIETSTNTVTVTITTDKRAGALVDCNAKAISEPKNVEVIELTPNNMFDSITYPKTRDEQEKTWIIKSPKGQNVRLKCDISMYPFSSQWTSGTCANDIFTVQNDGKTTKICGLRPFELTSSTGEIKIRAEIANNTGGRFSCVVDMNVPAEKDENDSSEHGVAPGRKTTTCPCGAANKKSGRIFNGTETEEGEYPFMVSMRGRSSGAGHFCGASIISPLHILTAAHCVSDSKTKSKPEPSELGPLIGAHHIWDTSSHGKTKKVFVKEVFIADEWFSSGPRALAGDIAILLLTEPIKYNRYVSPVCLSPNPLPVVNKYIKAIGWGATETGDAPTRLLDANVLVLDKNRCNRNEKEICFKTGPSTSCFGDSGGPYVYLDPETNRYTQAGLASYVYGGCTGSYFIGTNTVYWHNWIRNIVKSTSPHDVCIKAD